MIVYLPIFEVLFSMHIFCCCYTVLSATNSRVCNWPKVWLPWLQHFRVCAGELGDAYTWSLNNGVLSPVTACSKFVPRGSRRISTAVVNSTLECTAFLTPSPNQKVVVMVMNTGDQPVTFKLADLYQGMVQAVKVTALPHSIQTFFYVWSSHWVCVQTDLRIKCGLLKIFCVGKSLITFANQSWNRFSVNTQSVLDPSLHVKLHPYWCENCL